MVEYEIRILSPAMQPTHSVYGMYSTDDEAVLEAKRCAAGQAVEVWRGSTCIFRIPADTAHSIQVP